MKNLIGTLTELRNTGPAECLYGIGQKFVKIATAAEAIHKGDTHSQFKHAFISHPVFCARISRMLCKEQHVLNENVDKITEAILVYSSLLLSRNYEDLLRRLNLLNSALPPKRDTYFARIVAARSLLRNRHARERVGLAGVELAEKCVEETGVSVDPSWLLTVDMLNTIGSLAEYCIDFNTANSDGVCPYHSRENIREKTEYVEKRTKQLFLNGTAVIPEASLLPFLFGGLVNDFYRKTEDVLFFQQAEDSGLR